MQDPYSFKLNVVFVILKQIECNGHRRKQMLVYWMLNSTIHFKQEVGSWIVIDLVYFNFAWTKGELCVHCACVRVHCIEKLFKTLDLYSGRLTTSVDPNAKFMRDFSMTNKNERNSKRINFFLISEFIAVREKIIQIFFFQSEWNKYFSNSIVFTGIYRKEINETLLHIGNHYDYFVQMQTVIECTHFHTNEKKMF